MWHVPVCTGACARVSLGNPRDWVPVWLRQLCGAHVAWAWGRVKAVPGIRGWALLSHLLSQWHR